MKKQQRPELLTVLVENTILSREDGRPVKRGWVLYSAPTSKPMAFALAENLKRVNVSYRIMTEDGKGKIVAQWLRSPWLPDDGRDVET